MRSNIIQEAPQYGHGRNDTATEHAMSRMRALYAFEGGGGGAYTIDTMWFFSSFFSANDSSKL